MTHHKYFTSVPEAVKQSQYIRDVKTELNVTTEQMRVAVHRVAPEVEYRRVVLQAHADANAESPPDERQLLACWQGTTVTPPCCTAWFLLTRAVYSHMASNMIMCKCG